MITYDPFKMLYAAYRAQGDDHLSAVKLAKSTIRTCRRSASTTGQFRPRDFEEYLSAVLVAICEGKRKTPYQVIADYVHSANTRAYGGGRDVYARVQENGKRQWKRLSVIPLAPDTEELVALSRENTAPEKKAA